MSTTIIRAISSYIELVQYYDEFSKYKALSEIKHMTYRLFLEYITVVIYLLIYYLTTA